MLTVPTVLPTNRLLNLFSKLLKRTRPFGRREADGETLTFQCDLETESCNLEWTSAVTNTVSVNEKGPIILIFHYHIRT